MRGLKDKVFIVAGGASGIAAATAERLAEEGAKVVVGDINFEGAQALASKLQSKGAKALAVRFDLADEASCKALATAAQDKFGAVHGLFNSGFLLDIANDLDVLTTSDATINRTWEINTMGFVRTIRHTLPLMLKGGGGTIVNMSSSVVTAGEPQRVAYGLSKGAIEALTRHVASRWGLEGIRCNTIASGIVMTPTVRRSMDENAMAFIKSRIRVPEIAEPDQLASAAVFLLSDESRYTNGKLFYFDGGWGLL